MVRTEDNLNRRIVFIIVQDYIPESVNDSRSVDVPHSSSNKRAFNRQFNGFYMHKCRVRVGIKYVVNFFFGLIIEIFPSDLTLTSLFG